MDWMGRAEFIASWPLKWEETADIFEFADRTECRDGDRDRWRESRSLYSSLGVRDRLSGEGLKPLSRTGDLDRSSRGRSGRRRSFPRRSRPLRGDLRLGAPRPGNQPRFLYEGLRSRLSPCLAKEGRWGGNGPRWPRGDGLRVLFLLNGGANGDSSRRNPGPFLSNGPDD